MLNLLSININRVLHLKLIKFNYCSLIIINYKEYLGQKLIYLASSIILLNIINFILHVSSAPTLYMKKKPLIPRYGDTMEPLFVSLLTCY
jgi:hypothetical protein